MLITLGILGIVIAMTLPSIIEKHQKKVTVEQLKSAYSLLYQAVTSSEIINGDISSWDYSFDVGGYRFFGMYLEPYLKGAVRIKKVTGKVWKSLDGTYCSDGSYMYTTPRYILPNGYHISVYSQPYTGNNIRKTSAWIIVDINGSKGPNRMGRDVFLFGIYPYLQDEIGKVTLGVHEQCGSGQIHARLTREELLNSGCATCKKDFTGYGYACGLLIQKDGWQIREDYPW